MADSGLNCRDARREGPLLVFGVHVYVNRSIGHVRMKVRELNGREPYGQEKHMGRVYRYTIVGIQFLFTEAANIIPHAMVG